MVSKNKLVNEGIGLTNKTIGTRLVEERKRLGLTQTDVRERTGVGKNAQINYEAGVTYPDAGYLASIHEAGFDLMYILTGNRSPEAALNPELQNLLDAYNSATLELRRSVFAALLSPYKRELDKSRLVPGYFRHQILGEADVRSEEHRTSRSISQEDPIGSSPSEARRGSAVRQLQEFDAQAPGDAKTD